MEVSIACGDDHTYKYCDMNFSDLPRVLCFLVFITLSHTAVGAV